MYFGDLRYVDLGLRNHRFNCFVHDDFKYVSCIKSVTLILIIHNII